jgi:hypothetical protein
MIFAGFNAAPLLSKGNSSSAQFMTPEVKIG